MASLASVYNHIVLPPQVPGTQDADIKNINDNILLRLIHATVTLGKLAGQEQTFIWKALRDSLRRAQNLHELGRLEKQSLIAEFRRLEVNEPLVLHVAEQNAALIIRRDSGDNTDMVIFEAFETSPPSADVLACERALIWNFPDCAVQIPMSEFQSSSLQDAMADFLEKGSLESLRQFQTFTTKAQTSVVESRGTASPALVTHLLIPLLEALGSQANVPRLKKRVRDDVNFQVAEFPWRRSPFWLVLRVFAQRQLHLLLGYESGRACYKFLMATMLVELLNECPSHLAPELTMMLRAKVCRRLAKLEQEKRASPVMHKHLFAAARPFFKEQIQRVTNVVQSAWEKFKRETKRPIPPLPPRADGQSLYLSLPNSGQYLQNIIDLPRTQDKVQLSQKLPPLQDSTIRQVEQFTNTYFELASLEEGIEMHRIPQIPTTSTPQSRCIALAEAISDLFKTVGKAYASDPGQTSIFILSLFTLWVRLDKEMIHLCPLLGDFHPVFSPELLDALHLPTASQMQQLRDIQLYLQNRSEGCLQQTTIFSEPDEYGFTMRYVAQSAKMQNRLRKVQKASDAARQAKMVELDDWQEKYDDHSLGISSGTCVCKFNRDGSRNVKGCSKCWHWRTRNKMAIYAHEDFLPGDAVKAAAVVFELSVPDSIAAYRNATWKIFGLCYPDKPTCSSPSAMLSDQETLKGYMTYVSNDITIASTSKSFHMTHFKVTKQKMKASEKDILFPNGLNFFYFDTTSNAWVKDFDKALTIQHLCGVCVPLGLQESIMPRLTHPPTEIDGLTSYEIVASETKCPSNMSIKEFTTYQRLLSGKARRWLTMLVELGASDANFSSETTLRVFTDLAVQAGPARVENNFFRDVHVVFKDSSFCQQLAEQIAIRLRNISSNWREVHCMEILITISLRLSALRPSSSAGDRLLKEARNITLEWITRLRTDVRIAKQASGAGTAANYAFWAALLCRRTFSTFADSKELIPQDDLSIFFQASLALQENLIVDLTKLPTLLKNMLVRDTKQAYSMQSLILKSINASQDSIGLAINASWSDSGKSVGKIFAQWETLSYPSDRWVTTIMTGMNKTSAKSQRVHYNFIEGHLLVDHKPLGRLPHDIRESNEVKQLFGDQNLLTFPSGEVGMSYVMANWIRDHEIHFGIRKSKVIIRARSRDGIFELIPSNVFAGPDSVDIPFGLLSGCVHWLNLRTKCIEIRRQTVPWRTRLSDWTIDLKKRNGRRKDSYLVDPNSLVFNNVASIFRHFEEARKITVFQPMKGKLSVELRHLELSFFVNPQSLLQCRELGEEIDPNQDAGTLYGFESKIVLRDVVDKNRRSIIVPSGKVSSKRCGMHVAVRAASSNVYLRFGIDDVLGRLSCPAEPRLLYAKAQLHALTSFVIPDPLTGQTGTDEAMHILQSAYCQPWTPPGIVPIETLNALGDLSPKREYYPKDRRDLQSVDWNTDLTMTIQHDAYESLVQSILCKSERLSIFAPNREKGFQIRSYIPTMLRKRGILRRSLYECSNLKVEEWAGRDTIYQSRGQQPNSSQAGKVYHIVRMLHIRPFTLNTTRELSSILQDWPLIGGFCSVPEFSTASLSDVIERKVDEQWGSLVNLCRKSTQEELHALTFGLSLMALNPKNEMSLIQILAAFASIPELKDLETPSGSAYSQFKFKERPSAQSLFKIISVDLPEKAKWKGDDAHETHRKACEVDGMRLAQHFRDQWPDGDLLMEGFNSNLIDTALAMERVIPEWHRLHHNIELSKYVVQVQGILKLYNGPRDISGPQAWNLETKLPNMLERGSVIPSLAADLLGKSLVVSINNKLRGDSTNGSKILSPITDCSTRKAPSKEMKELRKILASFMASSNALRREYGHDLEMSLTALEKTGVQQQASYATENTTNIARSIREIRATVTDHFNQIRNALAVDDDRFQWLDMSNLWPGHTSLAILEQLRSSSDHGLRKEVKEAIVSHGILITQLQRLLRIRNSLYHGNETRLQEELMNPGHENWNPFEFPDWLLLEIDSNIMIRYEQIDVAHAIIAPESGKNMLLQLNMGKGKTSCIVPMAMAILGNGEQLLRLIVPKSLLLPTAQMIQSRLGGLVGREIRHIPFSRRTDSSVETLQLYQDLHQDILRRRGVILNAPEHILSFKLSGLQHLASSNLDIAQCMINFQSWLNSTCRDVLDESDVSLAVKTQLIYPSGKQNAVDGHPQRWQVAQSLLSLVEDHLPHLRRRFPRSIEIIERGHGYPMIFFLHLDVEEDLHERIINDICIGRTAFLRLANVQISPTESTDIRKVLLDATLNHMLFKRVAALFADRKLASKNLLLIRGLLVNRILLLCLKKRWNVQYGLHPKRDPIAVPFEAKSLPSEQAEFGHPDVAILLTCLAFYYSGLNQNQFSDGLRQILSSHDPASEYDRWISACDTLPEALSHWNVINVDDQGQVEQLWTHLRMNKTVLDHYMNSFVFPAHAKQFGIKLQASGWDLPLFARMASGNNAVTRPRTTGFSGTNDNKIMLPLTIQQDDLPSLRQTNAEVLTYLLQDRNREYFLAAREGKRLSERGLLEELKEKNIGVLIDAGACILEMDNMTLAKTWLDIDTKPQAAVFFGADNRATVLHRGTKKTMPLLATSFVDNLDNCLVYFDEAHTRGVDLKLPQRARGALTLALGQTKDHTVQAAMRLRQLATTQSTSFFAFPETHRSILDVCKMSENDRVNSSHVVHWLLEQTCCANEQLQHLYLSQGLDFCDRTNAAWANADFISDAQDRDAFVKVLQRPEQQTLEQLYGNHMDEAVSATSICTNFPQIQVFVNELNEKRRAAASQTNALHSSAMDEVEQEREVEFQVEEVREVQKPIHYKPLKFPGLHPAISSFVETGLLSGGAGYENVFAAISRTSLGQKFGVSTSNSQLFVSEQFMRTIKTGKHDSIDNFQRPVEWILYNRRSSTALILIAEEAELLIPQIRAHKASTKVHLLIYSAPVTKKMLRFSTLTYYALPALPVDHVIPHWLTIELGIFAGRLYLGFDECASLSRYIEERDGHVARQHELGKDPVSFLLEWLSLRRRGQDITHTPMGYICQGRTLNPGHAFFVAHGVDSKQHVAKTYRTNGHVDELSEEEPDEEIEWDGVDEFELA